jgi:hypothetical protein
MRYQLVLQFRPRTEFDIEMVVTIEAAVMNELGDSASVDGHDFGSGEFNIFIFTDNPDESFLRVQKILQTVKPDGAMNVAYRDTGEDEYVVLWPPDSAEFRVI